MGSIIFFPRYFKLQSIDSLFLIKVSMTTLVSWLPIHIIKKLIECIDPSDYLKVQNEVRYFEN